MALTAAIGFQPEAHYSPHVTLAHANNPPAGIAIDEFLTENLVPRITPVLLTKFVLYASTFADGLSEYREAGVFPLARLPERIL